MSMTNPVKNLDALFLNETNSHTIVEALNKMAKSTGRTLDDMVPILGEARWPRNIAEAYKVLKHIR